MKRLCIFGDLFLGDVFTYGRKFIPQGDVFECQFFFQRSVLLSSPCEFDQTDYFWTVSGLP